jgi:hypothetical protein
MGANFVKVQQSLLFHLAGLPLRRPERPAEFFERGGQKKQAFAK